jgi:hypothetical protein
VLLYAVYANLLIASRTMLERGDTPGWLAYGGRMRWRSGWDSCSYSCRASGTSSPAAVLLRSWRLRPGPGFRISNVFQLQYLDLLRCLDPFGQPAQVNLFGFLAPGFIRPVAVIGL